LFETTQFKQTAEREDMLAKIPITQGNNLKVHPFTAPEESWQVNSNIIELPIQLVVIDDQ
jgi:hypothetical protein